MANTLSRGTMFPPEITNELISKVKGKSSLARLSSSEPIPFNGKELFTFNFDKEIDVVGENGAKSNGGGTIAPVTIKPIKVEYGMRVSDEFRYAADEKRLEYLRAFNEGFSRKLAKGLDLMAMHGINPRSGNASTEVIGNNSFDAQVTTTVYQAVTANGTVESAVAAVQANEGEARGLIVSPAFRSALASEKDLEDKPLFPELGWGASPEVLKGLLFETNGTVSYGNSPDAAILGDFESGFRWGYASDIIFDMIEYGNPDNDPVAGDLKGHNQVYIRAEAYIGWGIVLPEAFVRVLRAPSVTLNALTATVEEGETVTLTATTFPAGATVTWASGDADVATVAGGVVTGVAEGETDITASITVEGKTYTATATVTVTAAE